MNQMTAIRRIPAQQVVVESCPMCGYSIASEYARFREFTWVRCWCGLIFKLGSAHSHGPARVGGEGSFGSTGYGQRYRARSRRRIEKSKLQIRDALAYVDDEALTQDQTLLDVGCSLGYTLLAAEQVGLKPVGVDVSEVAIQECRTLGFGAELAGLDALPFANDSFSVVTMKHVLEHTTEPRRSLREAMRVLRPGGALFIAVPHAGYRKAAKQPTRSAFYRPDSPGGVEHWVYYTPRTLAKLLHSEGFLVRRVHPRLWRDRESFTGWLLEALATPFKLVFATALTALGLRKEFWIVATKSTDVLMSA